MSPIRRHTLAIAFLLVVGLAVVTGFVAAPASASSDAILASAAFRPPTTVDAWLYPGFRQVSADGRYVVFTSVAPFAGIDRNGDADIFLLDRRSGDVLLVSHRVGRPGVAANYWSDRPVISADGSTVVFRSWATDLVDGTDENEDADVFHWDRASGEITLISHRFDSLTTTGDGGSGPERLDGGLPAEFLDFRPAVSYDGEVVIFRSSAVDLVGGLERYRQTTDLFAWERSGGRIKLVSRPDENHSGDPYWDSTSPSISADGRWVTFTSAAPNLVSFWTSGWNVYLWDRLTDEMRLVSRSAEQAEESGNNASLMSTISADGSTVAFASWAGDLVAGGDRRGSDIFLWYRKSGEMKRVSSRVEADDGSGGFDFYFPTLSADGSVVAYNMERRTIRDTWENRIDATAIFVWTDETGEQIRLSDPERDVGKRIAASRRPVVSADGNLVAFAEGDLDVYFDRRPFEEPQLEPLSDVWLWDRALGETRRISNAVHAGDVPGNGPSHTPLLSADGDTLAFVSRATDLTKSARSGLYVSDLGTGSLSSPVPELAPRPGITGNGEAYDVELSADGRFVAFATDASDLVDGVDENGVWDVFLLDRGSGEITLVSHAVGRPGVASDAGDVGFGSWDPAITSDGRFVAFVSTSKDLVRARETGDRRGDYDVYLWERETGEIRLVSHSVEGPLTYGDDASFFPSLSADGEAVAFASGSSNLVAGEDANRYDTDVFVWDRRSGEIRLASHVPGDPGRTPERGESSWPVISADGSVVAFESSAEELVDGLQGIFLSNVFVFDRESGEVELAFEVPPPSDGWIRNTFSPSLSADGRFVAYLDILPHLPPGEDSIEAVYLLDRSTGSETLVSHAEGDPEDRSGDEIFELAISADGSLVAFSSPAMDMAGAVYPERPVHGGAVFNLFAWEKESGEITLLSRSPDGSTAGNHHSWDPQISADGNRVVFTSKASNLIAGLDANRFAGDVLAWDRTTKELELLSHAAGRPQRGGNSYSALPRVSADGRVTAYWSRATDLVTGFDANGPGADVFVHAEEASAADLRLHGEEGSSSPGERVWSLEVENRGPARAHRLVLLHQLPDGTEFLDAVGEGWTCVHETGVLSCRHGALEVSERTASLSLRWLDLEGDGSAGQAAVEWPGRDPEPADNRWPRSVDDLEDHLTARPWNLDTLDGVPAADRRAHLVFQKHEATVHGLRGFTGCNDVYGVFELVGSRLDAEITGVSIGVCDGPRGEQERALYDLLASAPRVRFEDGDLIFETDSGSTARFTSP